MKRAVRSRRKVYGQLLKHARRQPHRECCGILAGQDGLITQAFPAKNVAADPVRNYEIAPKEIVRLMGELRKRRLEFLGIYHSHPHWLDTNEPSPKDIALACSSEKTHFIVTPGLHLSGNRTMHFGGADQVAPPSISQVDFSP